MRDEDRGGDDLVMGLAAVSLFSRALLLQLREEELWLVLKRGGFWREGRNSDLGAAVQGLRL